MPIRLSQIMGVPSKQLFDQGIYDSWVDCENYMIIDLELLCERYPGVDGTLVARQKMFAWLSVIIELVSHFGEEGSLAWQKTAGLLTRAGKLTSSLGFLLPEVILSNKDHELEYHVLHLLREFWGNKFDEFPDDLFLLIGERMGWSRLNNLIISIAAFALEDNRDDPAKTFTVGPTVNINGQDVVLIPGKILRRVPIMEGQVFAAGNIF